MQKKRAPIVLIAILIIFVYWIFFHRKQNVYDVKSYRYYNDNEVYVSVILKGGHIEEIMCAFAPDIDYDEIKRVKVGELRKTSYYGTESFYCNPIY